MGHAVSSPRADDPHMRFRTSLLVTLVTALALVATAVAGPGPGKPENRADRPAKCRGHVALKGAFVSAGTGSFTINVLRANRHGRALKGEQTVNVNDKTKIRRRGKEGQAAVTDLVKDDRLHVLARCTPGATAGSFTLMARLVLARAAKAADSDG